MSNLRYPFRKSWRWFLIDALDRVLDVVSIPKRQPFVPDAVRNILVIRLDHIGDVVCSLPVFPILKRRFPNARISVLVSQEGEALLAHHPYVDHVIVFRSNWFARTSRLDLGEMFRVLSELRNSKFDIGFDLRGDIRNIGLMVLARIGYRVGYGIGGGKSLLAESPPYDTKLHQVELARNLVTSEPISRNELKPEIYLTLEEKKSAWDLLASWGVSRQDYVIGLHPEAGYPSKEWGTDRYRDLVGKLIQKPETKVLVFGLDRAETVKKHYASSKQVVSCVGNLSLREAIATLHCCHVFIGNDSGLSHIAHALRIPTVVIASGTNEYEKWGVWLKPSMAVKHEVSCSPCHLEQCPIPGHPCLSDITVEQVAEAIRSVQTLDPTSRLVDNDSQTGVFRLT